LARCGTDADHPPRGPDTYASLLIAAGVNSKAVSTYMEHSSITITLDCDGHLMPGNEAEAADLLDSYLARERALFNG
jgi:integrase